MRKLISNYIDSFANERMIDAYFQQKQTELEGLSGAGTAQIIGKCVSFMDPDKVYLEVGIYQAANLVLVASKNKNKLCYGVDNFSQEFQENKNYAELTTEQVVQKRIKDFEIESNCKYFKADFREFLKDRTDVEGKKVEVYFFDGPHELQDQVDGVEMALPLLADNAFIFVDDWASENVQEAARILTERHKELTLRKIFKGSSNIRQIFNQGQCVFEYNRGIK